MLDLFLLLNLCTEEQGNWDMEFNPHRSLYNEANSEYYSEDFDKDELSKIDFNKDIYRLRWYQHTQVGFYDFIDNGVKGLIKQILETLEVPECFLTAGTDSIYFDNKYVLAHPEHAPIVISKGGKIETVTIDVHPSEFINVQNYLDNFSIKGGIK